jgi:hypothetical protein
MSNVDPVAVAKRCIEAPLNERMEPIAASSIGVQAMARVVIAAEEVNASIPATFDPRDGSVQRHAKALNALAAALKAE